MWLALITSWKTTNLMRGYPIHDQELYVASTVPLYHTTKMKGRLITRNDFVQQATVTANPVQQHYSKFILMRPTVLSQCLNLLYLVCMWI